MAANFELGKVPASILVSRALYMSERSLIGSNITVNVKRYLNFSIRSVPKLSISSGIHTYTSRTHASGAIRRAPQSLYMVECPSSWMLSRSEKTARQCVLTNIPLTAFNEICKENLACH